MSYTIGLDTLFLRPTPRLAHTELCDHGPLMRKYGGTSGWLDKKWCDAWELDFIFNTNDGPVPWGKRGRVTDMGHAEYAENAADFHQPKGCPFTDPEQVLEFDAVKEYGLPRFDDLVAYYEQHYQQMRKHYANQVYTGGYYHTIVSGAIAAFGWDMLLMAAADPERFAKVLDSFFRLTLHHVKAWAKTSIEVFIQHDDMVWTSGAFIAPDFYRSVIFPRYAELWSVLKQAGKKVLFCSDGDFTQFVDDIAHAGAEGFIFEPMTSLDAIVGKYGQTHAIIGSKVDCRTLTFGTEEQIRKEVDATLELAFKCPGFVFGIGNHIPANVPIEKAEYYFNYLKSRWTR